MALIKCPECGTEVSDKAATCPRCAYPIAKNSPSGTVRVKINIGDILKHAIVSEDGTELGAGRDGEVVVFHVDKPTNIRATGGGYKCPYQLVKAGERYSVQKSGMFGMTLRFNLVDVIDSE